MDTSSDNKLFAALSKIEKDNGIKIIFACESGSRATGLDT